MSNQRQKFITSIGLIHVLVALTIPIRSLSAETAKQETPVYETCTPAKSGGQFQAAICLLKQLCPACDFGTLNRNNIKIVVRNKEVDTLYVKTGRSQNYGLISASGTVEIRVMFGAINEMCLQQSQNATLSGHAIDEKGCVTVSWDGKLREFVYPPKFNELFKGKEIIFNGFEDDYSDRAKLTVAIFSLADSATICGNKFPKGTSFRNFTIGANIPYEVTLPDGATLADGKRPKENERIWLTDENYKCDIRIVEKDQVE